MTDGSAILLTAAGTVAGAVLGAVASWYFSRRYYLKAGADSTAALHPLLQAVRAIGRMLEQANLGKLTYDEADNITGIVITTTAHAQGSSTATAVGSVTITPPPQYDRQHEQPPTPEPEGDHA